VLGDRYKLYGAAPVSDRGQIVIPKEAREDLGVKAGDKLLVVGDVKSGVLILIKSDIVKDIAHKVLETIERGEKSG